MAMIDRSDDASDPSSSSPASDRGLGLGGEDLVAVDPARVLPHVLVRVVEHAVPVARRPALGPEVRHLELPPQHVDLGVLELRGLGEVDLRRQQLVPELGNDSVLVLVGPRARASPGDGCVGRLPTRERARMPLVCAGCKIELRLHLFVDYARPRKQAGSPALISEPILDTP
ncbi:hypothetical protein THAOC_19112, partial [Thalassiosira oceanica]